jgi:hypothetical protein
MSVESSSRRVDAEHVPERRENAVEPCFCRHGRRHPVGENRAILRARARVHLSSKADGADGAIARPHALSKARPSPANVRSLPVVSPKTSVESKSVDADGAAPHDDTVLPSQLLEPTSVAKSRECRQQFGSVLVGHGCLLSSLQQSNEISSRGPLQYPKLTDRFDRFDRFDPGINRGRAP